MTYSFVAWADRDTLRDQLYGSLYSPIFDLVDKALTERDSYREVAINHNMCYVRSDGAAERVDAEATRLIQEKLLDGGRTEGK